MGKEEFTFNDKPLSYFEPYFEELVKLDQQGRIKIVNDESIPTIGVRQMVIDTSYKGDKVKGSRARVGRRNGNMVTILMDRCCFYKNSEDFGFEDRIGEASLEDFLDAKLYEHTWYLRTDGYVYRSETKGSAKYPLSMHRLIMFSKYGQDAIEGMEIDHIIHERNDNQSDNIRITTAQENNDNNEVMYSVKINPDSGLFEFKYPGTSGDTYMRYLFDEFRIKFDAKFPEPISDFKKQQHRAKLYLAEHEKAVKELEVHPGYIKYLEEMYENIIKGIDNKD